MGSDLAAAELFCKIGGWCDGACNGIDTGGFQDGIPDKTVLLRTATGSLFLKRTAVHT